tara:strand:+ start:257 stop:796 length:540 start_codon:yes stop_codon:yes gene_type:complete
MIKFKDMGRKKNKELLENFTGNTNNGIVNIDNNNLLKKISSSINNKHISYIQIEHELQCNLPKSFKDILDDEFQGEEVNHVLFLVGLIKFYLETIKMRKKRGEFNDLKEHLKFFFEIRDTDLNFMRYIKYDSGLFEWVNVIGDLKGADTKKTKKGGRKRKTRKRKRNKRKKRKSRRRRR